MEERSAASELGVGGKAAGDGVALQAALVDFLAARLGVQAEGQLQVVAVGVLQVDGQAVEAV